MWMGLAAGARAQVIEFESGGLKYQTLTKQGVTIMFAEMPVHVREWSILQLAVSNGSSREISLNPENLTFHRKDGTVLRGIPAGSVIRSLMDRAGRNDVIRLVSTYELGLYGMERFRSTNGYEQRRQNALAEVGSTRLKAAAAASAIAFVASKLKPGESTDGAVFFATSGRPLGPGRLVVATAGQTFEFDSP